MDRIAAIRRAAHAAGIQLVFLNGATVTLPAEILRRSCPCAVCREARGEGAAHDTPLTPALRPSALKASKLSVITASRDESLTVAQLLPVGNYAISIRWGDGHDDGIYTFDRLLELARGVRTST